MLDFSLGLRREEIFGLKWQEINFDKCTMTIALASVYVPKNGIVIKDTKTDNSYRTLLLPPDIVAMLQEWRDEVKATAKRRAKRNKVVILDDPVGPDKWIFSQPDGHTVGHPHAFNNFLKRFCADHKLPLISPHSFRHLSGGYLLKSGLDIATISAKLGHSDKSFTMKTYIHELQSISRTTLGLCYAKYFKQLKTRNKKKTGQLRSVLFTYTLFNFVHLKCSRGQLRG
ncbi:MAG: integrase family protein [Pelosinus sp.]|jgi:integrase|nr:integrase family protein [Pelosinus sp.]